MSMLTLNPIRRFGNAAVRSISSVIPSTTFRSNGKITNGIKWVGQHISSPENRLILGVTALMSQPFIDLHNRHVDEKTKKISAARTVAKIIAGTTTGVIVRYACIAAANAFTHKPVKGMHKLYSLFYPKRVDRAARLGIEGYERVCKKGLDKYINFMGTLLSLGVMMITNFMIDAPLTKYLTNKFIKNIDNKITDKNTNHPQILRPISMDEFVNISLKNKEVNNGRS